MAYTDSTRQFCKCTLCKQIKPENCFYPLSGKQHLREPRCKDCHKSMRFKNRERKNRWTKEFGRKNQKERCKANAKIIGDYLQSHPCVDCGQSNPIVLEFDHIRGEKKFEVSRAKGAAYAHDILLKEIAKCEVRCGNCHRIKTGRTFGFWWSKVHTMQLLQKSK